MVSSPPFSPLQDAPCHPALALQFLLSELFKSHIEIRQKHFSALCSCSPCTFIYDWALPSAPLDKFYAHCQTLTHLFPKEIRRTKRLNLIAWNALLLGRKNQSKSKNKLLEKMQEAFLALEPFLASCKKDENLFLFLLKNQEKIDALMHTSYLYNFLTTLYPEGLEIVGEKMCDQYHQRGFFSQITECKLLLTQLVHERAATSPCP